ncbi:MAG: tetratricopeptide repeat protein, partial [Gemmatimonadota bacterium]|nr:tetratricopeptide repeat protein [Gemmatimonadota bacterium]
MRQQIGVLAILAACSGLSAWDAAGQTATAAEGLDALKRGDYTGAVQALAPLARAGDGSALRGLFYAHYESGALDEAEAAARQGVTSQTPGAESLLGRILMDRGHLDESRKVLKAASDKQTPGGAQARLNLGVLEYTYGDRERAYELFDSFIDYYNQGRRLGYEDLAAVGTAMVYLSRRVPDLAHDALRALDEAEAAGARDHRARLATGRLFLERYDAAHASESFRAVLRENQKHPEALQGLAMVAQLEGGGDPQGLLESALEGNPNLVQARVLLARIRLMGGDRPGAFDEIDKALEVNPADLDALATAAAIHHLTHDTSAFQETLAQIESLSRAPTGAYELMAELSADHRKYADAVDFGRRAVAADSTAWTGLGLMGLNQVRLGQVVPGRANLERAFAGDPFNLWFKNTLDLLDTFAEYRVVESEHFRFVLHESEADLLEPYIAPLAER